MVEELKDIRVKRKEMATQLMEDLGSQAGRLGCWKYDEVEESTALDFERPGY